MPRRAGKIFVYIHCFCYLNLQAWKQTASLFQQPVDPSQMSSLLSCIVALRLSLGKDVLKNYQLSANQAIVPAS